MTGSERRQRLKVAWYHRGRADQLVALAGLYGWDPDRIHALARKTGIDAADVCAAIERAAE